MDGKNHLFICGCPRSGTTALWRLLGASQRSVIGVERFGTLFFGAPLTPGLFEEDRFFDCQSGDTFYSDLERFSDYYAGARERFADATTVGDKIPKLYERFEGVCEHLPNAKILFLFRNIFDVAASYKARAENPDDATWRRSQGVEAAIRDWGRSIVQYRVFKERLQILPISYERFFHAREGLDEMLAFAGMDGDPDVIREFAETTLRSNELEARRKRDLTMDEVFTISTTANFGGYRQVVSPS